MQSNHRSFLAGALLALSVSTAGAQSIAVNEGLSGAWFDPATDGQGVLFDIVPTEDLVFMAWFTFEPANAKLGPGEARWLTAQGGIDGATAELTVNRTSGGVFDDPTPVSTEPAGSATVEFLSCTEARLSYDLPDAGLTGSIELTRLAPDVFCAGLLPTRLSATQALAALEDGRLSSSAYVEGLLALIEAYPQLNAFTFLDAEGARAAAAEADAARAAGEDLGPLHGLPIAVKDSINVAGMPTTAGTPALAGYTPETTAPAIQRLLDAGAIVIGKTNLHELSGGYTSTNLFTGPSANCYDFSRIPGGSSGGNAAALCAGFVPLTVGGDTTGSTRIPGALTGTAGFRPSTGRYPAGGAVPLAPTFDVLGPMARTIEDIALADAVLAGEPPEALEDIDLAGLRIGVPGAYFLDLLDPAVRSAFDEALTRLEERGAVLLDADFPLVGMDSTVAAASGIIFYELPRGLEAFFDAQGLEITVDEVRAQVASPDIVQLFDLALGTADAPPAIDEPTYLSLIEGLLPDLQGLYAAYFAGAELDAMVYPTSILPAAEIGAFELEVSGVPLNPVEAYFWNAHFTPLVGAPTATVPLGQLPDGLPAGGMDIAGLPGDDRRVLAIARAIEAALPAIRPPAPIRPVPAGGRR